MSAIEAPATFTIQDREVRLPVEVRDATAAVAYYLVPSARAQELIAPTGLRVASILAGRTFCTIGTMVYRDGDLGPYHEMAITFFVREPGAPGVPVVGGLIGMARGTLGAYIHQLPVDGVFSCVAGQTIWGFPKFIAEIDVSTTEDEQTSVLSVAGRHVLTQTLRMGGSRAFGERKQLSFSFRNAVLYRTPSLMSGVEVGARFRGGRLELGSHPLADELRSLGLPKRPLFSTTIGKMTGTFHAAEALGGVPPQR